MSWTKRIFVILLSPIDISIGILGLLVKKCRWSRDEVESYLYVYNNQARIYSTKRKGHSIEHSHGCLSGLTPVSDSLLATDVKIVVLSFLKALPYREVAIPFASSNNLDNSLLSSTSFAGVLRLRQNALPCLFFLSRWRNGQIIVKLFNASQPSC